MEDSQSSESPSDRREVQADAWPEYHISNPVPHDQIIWDEVHQFS